MPPQTFEFLFTKAKDLMAHTKDPNHNWTHVSRVLNRALEIKNLLHQDQQNQIDENILKLACVWHDISYTKHKPGPWQYILEGKRAKKIFKKHLDQTDLDKKEKDLLCNIVLYHPHADFRCLNKHRSLYHQILQDADWLDEFSEERREVIKKLSRTSLYWRLVNFISKPFFKYLKKNKQKYLNLKESFNLIK